MDPIYAKIRTDLIGMMFRFMGLWIGTFVACPMAVAQLPEQPEVRSHDTTPSFRIRVETNLVTVTVVVRDANGRPVRNLEKNDFRLFDSGKPQEITGFRVEQTEAKVTSPKAPASPSSTATPPLAWPLPQRFVALFFDDFHMAVEDVARTRKAAWRYLSTAVRPEDRVALFTSSGKEQVDFTSDRDKLHAALLRLASRSRTIPRMHQCPSIDEYQAYLIDRLQDSSALAMATGEGIECNCKGEGNDTPQCADEQMRMASMEAAQIWSLADMQSQWAFEVIQLVVRRLAAMPGQRSVVLVSPGFLSMAHTDAVDALVTQAVQQNIVINAIDAAGLYARIPNAWLTGVQLPPSLELQKNVIRNESLNVARDVLAGLSAGTGGVFFQNSNDFDRGFRETAETPEAYYVLTFSTHNVKFDGKFHPLRVVLNTREKLRIEARRGYVAPRPAGEETARKQTEIETLVFSLEELHGLPAEMTAQVEKGGQTFMLAVRIHVDISLLDFRKDADRNIDTLIFDTALFDQDGKYVAGKQGSLDLRFKDASFQKLKQSGINAVTKFEVAPGSYRVRELVRDTGSKELSALNYRVQVPR